MNAVFQYTVINNSIKSGRDIRLILNKQANIPFYQCFTCYKQKCACNLLRTCFQPVRSLLLTSYKFVPDLLLPKGIFIEMAYEVIMVYHLHMPLLLSFFRAFLHNFIRQDMMLRKKSADLFCLCE